jgi:hypothetical protein
MIIGLCAGTTKKLPSNTMILKLVTKLNALCCRMNLITRPCKDANVLSIQTNNDEK